MSKLIKSLDVRSIDTAQKFITDFKYPDYTPIVRVVEGAETPQFKQHFADGWPLPAISPVSDKPSGPAKKKDEVSSGQVAAGMVKKQATAPATDGPDDGNGTTEAYLIQNFKMLKLMSDSCGELWAGNSYIFKYGYSRGKDTQYIIYFWQGRNSTIEDKGASALLATQTSDECMIHNV